MFTGIIDALGRVVRRTPDPEGVELTIAAPDAFAKTRDGDSIAVNGGVSPQNGPVQNLASTSFPRRSHVRILERFRPAMR